MCFLGYLAKIMVDFKKKLEEEEQRQERLSETPITEGVLLKGRRRKKFTIYTTGLIIIALIFTGRILMSSQNGTDWFGDGLFNRLVHFSPDRQLKGEENDRVNILLLGMGGEGHDGAYLTDTVMLASFQPSTKQVALISFPRDLVSPVSGWQKINTINAYAEQKEAGSGGPATAAALGQLLQIPIDYYVRVDFNGFIDIIDELGGIEVNVENTLDDYSYPIMGQEDNPSYYSRFEHLHFDPGPQSMSGSLALKYARSRHGVGGEGSDFARARRQQLVLEAIKNKLLSAKTLLNPVMIAKLSDQFSKNISTNISSWEALRLWDIAKEVDRSQIINRVLSDAPDGLLVSGKGENGAYILTPRSGNFSAIRNLAQSIFLLNPPISDTEPARISDSAAVVILNGTWVTGLAGKTSATLEGANFSVIQIGNAPQRDYSESAIYDLTGGEKKDSLDILRQITGASAIFESPAWLTDYRSATTGPDFILIVGTDSDR